MVMVAVRTGRIGRDGQIVAPDRSIHTTKDPAKGGPDRVRWVALNNGSYEIRFERSPFLPNAGPQTINVSPVSDEYEVQAREDAYKYSVFDNTQTMETDDPEVVIE